MKQTIAERLASKYKRTKKWVSIFHKDFEITKEEHDWIKENPDEFERIINDAEKDKNFCIQHYDLNENDICIDMTT